MDDKTDACSQWAHLLSYILSMEGEMAEIIIEERKGMYVSLTCPACGAEATMWTDDKSIAKAGKDAFKKEHRKCKEGVV